MADNKILRTAFYYICS